MRACIIGYVVSCSSRISGRGCGIGVNSFLPFSTSVASLMCSIFVYSCVCVREHVCVRLKDRDRERERAIDRARLNV